MEPPRRRATLVRQEMEVSVRVATNWFVWQLFLARYATGIGAISRKFWFCV